VVEHLVLIKYKADTTAEQKQQLIDGLKSLKGRIDGIEELTVGENFSERAHGFQIGVLVRFRDRASLEAYGPHPVHQEVVQRDLLPIKEDVIVVDFEG
jgi:hypothetical protein